MFVITWNNGRKKGGSLRGTKRRGSVRTVAKFNRLSQRDSYGASSRKAG